MTVEPATPKKKEILSKPTRQRELQSWFSVGIFSAFVDNDSTGWQNCGQTVSNSS
jgi:hypothetical protein